MNKSIYSCDHIGIFTKNAERLIKFYRNILGFKLISGERLQTDIVKKLFRTNSTCCFYRLKSEKLILEIFEPHYKNRVEKRKNHYGLHHFGLTVSDREQFINYLRKKQVKIITIKRNERKVYFIEDPEGNMIEIREA